VDFLCIENQITKKFKFFTIEQAWDSFGWLITDMEPTSEALTELAERLRDSDVDVWIDMLDVQQPLERCDPWDIAKLLRYRRHHG
jgi:hypothetical protein